MRCCWHFYTIAATVHASLKDKIILHLCQRTCASAQEAAHKWQLTIKHARKGTECCMRRIRQFYRKGKRYSCDGIGLSATHAVACCDAIPLSAAQRIAKGHYCLGLVATRSVGRRDSLLRLHAYGGGDDKSCGS